MKKQLLSIIRVAYRMRLRHPHGIAATAVSAILMLTSGFATAETLAWWRFEAGPDGSNVVHYAVPGVYTPDVPDVSGYVNDLSCWTEGDWAGYAYSADVFGPALSLPGSNNLYSVRNTGGYPVLYTGPSAFIHTLEPPEWSIEVAFQPESNGSFRTLVGRDSIGTGTNDPNLAALYLQITPSDQLAIKYIDVSGVYHEAISAPGLVQGYPWATDPDGLTGEWQAAVATCDGTILRLYHRNIESGDPYFRLVAEADLSASGSTDTRLTAGAGSGGDWTHGTWTVGRGLYAGNHGDRAYGFIDEVRISGSALNPSEFLLGDVGYYLQIDRLTGEIFLHRNESVDNMVVYTLSSFSGALNPANWNSIAATGDADSGGSVDANDVWQILVSTSTSLSETDPIGGGGPDDGVPLPAGTLQLGAPGTWAPDSAEDVTMEMVLLSPSFIEYTVLVPVIYTGANEWVVLNTNNLGYGSLRQAVEDAEDGDTVIFDSSLSNQTILLTGPRILVTNNLIIDASSIGGITIDSAGYQRAFSFSSGTTNEIYSLTMINGSTTDGGGIFNNGVLTVNDCTITGNTASGRGGGIYNNGFDTLILNNCTIAGNTATNLGGGIYSGPSSELTIDNSTIAGNEATLGAGIHSAGTLTLDDSTLSGNVASSWGGGILKALDSTAMTINNATIVSNVASDGGGIYNDTLSGTLTIGNSTIYDNSASLGGGMFNDGDLIINNTIVAANAGGNLIPGSGTVSGTNNHFIGDPMLADLGDYGGPTFTCPPMPGSPVIDAGGNALAGGLSTDQRGMTRILSGGFGPPIVDIGAVEWNGWLHGMDVSGLDPGFLLPGSVYDSTTVFPDGFDPGAAGMLACLTPSEQNGLIAQGESNVTGDPETYGLYTGSAFQALALDRPFITFNSGTGTFVITVGLLHAPTPDGAYTNLTNIVMSTAYPEFGEVDIEFTPPSPDVRFFELYGNEPTP